MHKKKQARLRRVARARKRLSETAKYRLCVNRTPRHIYAQIMFADGSRTILSVSSLHREVKDGGRLSKTEQATLVGQLVAKRAIEKDIRQVAFDRSGFFFHGRVKALADAACEQGLKI